MATTQAAIDGALALLERVYGPARAARFERAGYGFVVAALAAAASSAGCVHVPGAQVCTHYERGRWDRADQAGASVCVDVAAPTRVVGQ